MPDLANSFVAATRQEVWSTTAHRRGQELSPPAIAASIRASVATLSTTTAARGPVGSGVVGQVEPGGRHDRRVVVHRDDLRAQGFLLGLRLGDGGSRPVDSPDRGVGRVIARSGTDRGRLPGVVGQSHVSVGRVALAVCLLFDRRSERAVRALWDRLERAGVPSLRSHTHGQHMPHVSYAVLRAWDWPRSPRPWRGLAPSPRWC